MKKHIKYILQKFFLKPMLTIHSKSYYYSSILASFKGNGIHPKHDIMKYKEWFLDKIKSDWVILDVGCNTGMMPAVMSTKANVVYGIEINCKLIEEAKCKYQKQNIEFICADATTFDYAPLKAIDCVTLSNVLEHIENREQFLKNLIDKIKWRDKKRFLIRVPMIDREWIVQYKKELGVEYRLDETHYIEYTFEQFLDELNTAGIKMINYHIRWGEIYAVCEVK